MKLKKSGFTLVEILVTLAVFAVLASITSSALYYAFNSREKVNLQANQLSKIQMAVSIMQQDINQIVQRGIRSNEMRLFPPIIGKSNYLEFTREGNGNPNSAEQRSTLLRVAYLCSDNTLIHRIWTSLDAANRNNYQDKILLDNLSDCHWSFLNQHLQSLSEWREQPKSQKGYSEVLPKAVQIHLHIKAWGNMSLLFAIPEAVYETI